MAARPGGCTGGATVRDCTTMSRRVLASGVRRNIGRIGVLAALLLLAGCSRQAELTLQQPSAPAYIRSVALRSDWAFYRPGDSSMAVLLSFPLPGTADGPRDFHLYLETPDREGEAVVGPDADSVRGFLIQEVGALKGKTALAAGRLRINRPWSNPELREIELDLRCDDETLILGTACARPSPAEIATFERTRTADIAALRSDREPVASDAETAPRAAASDGPEPDRSSASE